MMERIEIKQIKKMVIFFTIVLIIAFVFSTYYVFFSGKFDDKNLVKIVQGIANSILLYTIVVSIKGLYKNKPVLIFTKSDIEINEKGKPVSYLWQQITNWKITEEGDGGTNYLTIETADSKKKINISWLTKRPSEIEEILKLYKPNVSQYPD